MELFTTLFSDLLVFVYHCFDRIVIHGYSWKDARVSLKEKAPHMFRHAFEGRSMQASACSASISAVGVARQGAA
jgi:hypothetical protein